VPARVERSIRQGLQKSYVTLVYYKPIILLHKKRYSRYPEMRMGDDDHLPQHGVIGKWEVASKAYRILTPSPDRRSWLNHIQRVSLIKLSMIEIPALLEIEPEIRSHVKELRESQRR
jgi:hypothetical protein